jgi:transcriptional regulator with XRE-family HTH domain
MKFGERIKGYRLAKRMTQAEVCRATKLSAGFFSDVENGKRSVSADTLFRLSKVFGVSMDRLYTGRDGG